MKRPVAVFLGLLLTIGGAVAINRAYCLSKLREGDLDAIRDMWICNIRGNHRDLLREELRSGPSPRARAIAAYAYPLWTPGLLDRIALRDGVSSIDPLVRAACLDVVFNTVDEPWEVRRELALARVGDQAMIPFDEPVFEASISLKRLYLKMQSVAPQEPLTVGMLAAFLLAQELRESFGRGDWERLPKEAGEAWKKVKEILK